MLLRITFGIIVGTTTSLAGPAVEDDLGAKQFRSDAEKVHLIQKAVEKWNMVNAWLIEYEAKPSVATKGAIPVHKIMAVSGPANFYHQSAHFPPSNPWQVDPFCQELLVRRGRTRHTWRFSRAYSEKSINAGDYLPGTTWMDVLLGIIPRWPVTEYKMPADPATGAPVILIEAVWSADCRLLASSESIGKEQCAVLDYKGIERFWIATNKDLCLMRRDIRDPRSRKLVERILTDKVAAVGAGLWLPAEYRVQFFRTGTNEDVIEQENTVHILRCLLGDNVALSTFTPTNVAGSLKYDDNGRIVQVSAGGEDLLDDIVDFMVKYAALPSRSTPHDPSVMWLLIGLGGGLCFGLLFRLANRCWA